MFPFDLLSPKKWIESILGTALIITLILIPGWKVLFAGQSFVGSVSALIKHFPSTMGKSIRISYSYYRGLFDEEAKEQFEKLKKETIETLEEKSEIK